MAEITLTICDWCEYYQEPFKDTKGIHKCNNCTEMICDDCKNDHAMECCFG